MRNGIKIIRPVLADNRKAIELLDRAIKTGMSIWEVMALRDYMHKDAATRIVKGIATDEDLRRIEKAMNEYESVSVETVRKMPGIRIESAEFKRRRNAQGGR
jgi:hypothetical protein